MRSPPIHPRTIAFDRWLKPESRTPTDSPRGAVLERIELPARSIPCLVCERGDDSCPRCAGSGLVTIPDRELGDTELVDCYFRQMAIERFKALDDHLPLDRPVCDVRSPSVSGDPLYRVILVADGTHSSDYISHVLELIFDYDAALAACMAGVLRDYHHLTAITCRLEVASVLCDHVNHFGPDLRLPDSRGSMTTFLRLATGVDCSDEEVLAIFASHPSGDPDFDQAVLDCLADYRADEAEHGWDDDGNGLEWPARSPR